MHTFSKLAVVILISLSRSAIAEPAFEISGLHIDMLFDDAVAQAEKGGGVCQLSTSRRGEEVVYAQCEYQSCEEGETSVDCDKRNQSSLGISVASQPIVRVGIEAPGAASPLTRIFIFFDGNVSVVEEHLTQEYGPPRRVGSVVSEKSWTRARRLVWKHGKYNLGLWTTQNVIVLTGEPGSGAP
jgi:hypothetical protein